MTHNHERTTSRGHWSGKRTLRIIGATLVGIAFAGLFALLFGFLVKVLWNWLMPPIFGLGTIGYWQAFGLVILAKLLFGGFGPHGDSHHSKDFHRKIDDRWHRFIGVEDPGKRGGQHGPSRWHLYERFWREEGSAAFDAYVEKTASQKAEGQGDSDPGPAGNH